MRDNLTIIAFLSLLPSVLAQEAEVKLLPADGAAGDVFGFSVGISGTTAIVGAYGDRDNGDFSGSAYLFDTASGVQTAKLQSGDGAAGDVFGFSVGISGTTAIVGARWDDDNGIDSGSAYLFDTTTGAEVAKLTASDGAADDWFGHSVAISGTTAIVGAHRDDDNGFDSGAAYLFDVTTGAEIAKLLPGDGAAGDVFGLSVGISGTTAIVGAYRDDDKGVDSGAAYLFDVTTGAEIAKLLPDDGADVDYFGASVAISGTTAIIGANGVNDNGFDSGAAYLFDITTGAEIAKLLPEDGAAYDFFGGSVAISGSTAFVGADSDDVNGNRSGSAYLFDTTTGSQIAKLVASDGDADDYFGYSVGISGSTAIAASRLDDDNGIDSGSAYLFAPDCNGNGQSDLLEISIGASADCNGNSIPDECELADNPGLDLNENGILDSCECIIAPYCVTSPNTAGAGAVMGVAGSSSVSVNDLVLLAGSCPSGQFGVFFYGPGQVQVPFGDGFRCVGAGGAGLNRFPPVSTGFLGVAGYAVDNTDPPSPSGQITAGSTWNFQFWYRDPMGGPAGFNLSDALEITFCP